MTNGTALVKFSIEEATIAEWKEMYCALTINGAEDKDGYTAVHNARMLVKGTRVEIEHSRTGHIKKAQQFINGVNSDVQHLTALMKPIEAYLQGEEDKYNEAKAAIKEEADRKKQAQLQDRINRLGELNVTLSVFDIGKMTDPEFYSKLKHSKDDFDREKARVDEGERIKAEQEEEARIAREKEDARIASERAELEKKQAELEKKQAEQAEEQARIDADRKRIDAEQAEAQAKIDADRLQIEEEKRATERAEDIRIAERDAADKATRAEHARIAKEAKEEAGKVQAAEEESKRQEALKPDKDKLHAYADALLDVPEPGMDSIAGEELIAIVRDGLYRITVGMYDAVENL